MTSRTINKNARLAKLDPLPAGNDVEDEDERVLDVRQLLGLDEALDDAIEGLTGTLAGLQAQLSERETWMEALTGAVAAERSRQQAEALDGERAQRQGVLDQARAGLGALRERVDTARAGVADALPDLLVGATDGLGALESRLADLEGGLAALALDGLGAWDELANGLSQIHSSHDVQWEPAPSGNASHAAIWRVKWCTAALLAS